MSVTKNYIERGEKEMSKKSLLIYKCLSCKEVHQFEVNARDYDSWQGGMLLQEAMPYLTPGQRELMISGTCEKCFMDIFA